MNNRYKILLIFFTSILLTSCGNSTNQYVSKNGTVMGTIVNIKVYGDNAEDACEKSMEYLKDIEDAMSVNKENSELSILNKKAAKENVTVSKELFDVIKQAIYYANLTEGCFDPTIGNIIDMWGIGTDNAKIPGDELNKYIGIKGYKKVIMDEKNLTIHFDDDRIKINLGAILKGYVADRLYDMLVNDYKIQSGIINLGGNVMVIGSKIEDNNQKTEWTVGIQNPDDIDSIIKKMTISNGTTVVTSGDYERFFIADDGVKYHHIIDPFTGYPANNDISSSTIICNKSITADALSTATFVMGMKRAKKFVDSLDNIDIIFVDKEGRLIE